MSNYIRPKQRGATVFFTVTLATRGTDILTREIEALRQAVRATRAERPFAIDAWVVLPDHMHCVWTLPQTDSDFSTKMGAIKARFTRAVAGSIGGVSPHQYGWFFERWQRSGGVEPHPTVSLENCQARREDLAAALLGTPHS